MKTTTVNISFQKELLEDIDAVARAECRTRSDLLREAARLYIDRRERWNGLFDTSARQATDAGAIPDDIGPEIAAFRAGRRSR